MVKMVMSMIQGNLQDELSHSRQTECKHCNGPLTSANPAGFCCHGCETAYHLIHELNLSDFYTIQKNLEQRSEKVQNLASRDFALYDMPEFQASFCKNLGNGFVQCNMFVENLNCYACVWLCERAIRALAPEHIDVTVSLASGKVSLQFDPKLVSLSQVASRFASLGYPVSANPMDADTQRRDLLRLGIAGFCFMNIMILAIAEYIDGDSIDPNILFLFRLISFILASISVCFAAQSFYLNTWRAIKQKLMHLDIPISIAIASSYLYSVYQFMIGGPYIYFDSLTAIVFLLLSGRYIQKITLNTHLRAAAIGIGNQLDYVNRIHADSSMSAVGIDSVRKGDFLRVLPHGLIPLRSRLLSPKAEINYELMTGEANLLEFAAQDLLDAGGVNGLEVIDIEAVEDGLSSYLHRLSEAAKSLSFGKGQYALLSEKLSKRLTITVLLASSLTFFICASFDLNEAIRRTITMLLIACPCAFGLGVPLVLARAFDKGLKVGVLWNGPKALEKIGSARTFYFDKTGTLTKPFEKLDMTVWKQDLLVHLGICSETLLSHLIKLSRYSEHHVAMALAVWAKTKLDAPDRNLVTDLDHFKELAGEGISFKLDSYDIKIGRWRFCFGDKEPLPAMMKTCSFVAIDGVLLGAFQLLEVLDPSANVVVDKLKRIGSSLYILSGDHDFHVKSVADALSIDVSCVHAGLTPEQKHIQIQKQGDEISVMVGNGLNDMTALASSQLGIAVKGACDLAKKHADMILLGDGLTGITQAQEISLSCQKVIRRCFGFSLLFNTVGISLAASGLISPVVAAILMPISSLSVIAIATRW